MLLATLDLNLYSLCVGLGFCIYCPETYILQRDNVRNQRENVILIIANAQSRLGLPDSRDPVSTCVFIYFLVVCYFSSFEVILNL